METQNQKSYVEHAEQIFQKAENSKLSESFFIEVENDLQVLCEYLQLSPQQVVFLVVLLNKSFDNYRVTFDCVSKYLGKSVIGLLHYRDDFNYLVDHNYLEMDGETTMMQFDNMHGILVNRDLKTALVEGLPLPKLKDCYFENPLDLIHEINQSVEIANSEKTNKTQLHKEITELLDTNTHLSLVEELKTHGLTNLDIGTLLFCVWENLFIEEHCNLYKISKLFFETQLEQLEFFQTIKNREHNLLSTGLITLKYESPFHHSDVLFSEKCIKIFHKHDLAIENHEKENKLFINADKMEAKTLIFDACVQESLSLIQNALQEDQLKQIQNKLGELHGNKGIIAMLHGYPGTGKTEFAKQLALRTNRELLWVNISETKSYWYGESQKLMKQVFDDYRKKAKSAARIPILLFNEADAIFSRRFSDMTTPVGETHNAIQNILLEEMERFDGVLIATTNLTDNFDAAFERRFLFKVNFPKPNENLRQLIWKSKLPKLRTSDYQKLANQFDFTGGQIDNIIRKKVIYEITQGKQVNMNQLIAFCEDETINQNVKKIGF